MKNNRKLEIKPENKEKTTDSKTSVFFDSNEMDYFDYDLQRLKKWNNSIRHDEGDPADGKYEVNNHIVNIVRNNVYGRLVLKLKRFSQKEESNSFIKRDIEKSNRNIEIEFEAKISGEAIDVWTIFQSKDSYEWIESELNNIRSKEWNKFIIRKTINSNIDFIVRFEDANCKKLPCSYQMRNIIIRELYKIA